VLAYLIGLVVTGLVVGALGRLAVPGPNPMSIAKTILIGIAGAFVGGMVGYAIFGPDAPGLLFAVLAAAGIVWFLERREQQRA
jgi:uncharacterized membrane protein YeaQ/YmgE (transglycosylase-associated protein family)